MKLTEIVAELNPLDEFWEAVLTIELPPFLLGGEHQLESHGEAGLAAEAAFGAFHAVTNRGEGALDRVRGADVLPDLMIALNAN